MSRSQIANLLELGVWPKKKKKQSATTLTKSEDSPVGMWVHAVPITLHMPCCRADVGMSAAMKIIKMY